jgi:hypothetical protein
MAGEDLKLHRDQPIRSPEDVAILADALKGFSRYALLHSGVVVIGIENVRLPGEKNLRRATSKKAA